MMLINPPSALAPVSLAPAVLPPAALHELKNYLRITLDDEDAILISALRSSIEICANFIGADLLSAQYKEDIMGSRDWQHLTQSPIIMIDDVMGVLADGSLYNLPLDHYAIDILYGGKGRIRLLRSYNMNVADSASAHMTRARVTYRAGLSADWSSLAEPLRNGVVRMAAHIYSNRDNNDGPPIAIAALWQPYRRMRLS